MNDLYSEKISVRLSSYVRNFAQDMRDETGLLQSEVYSCILEAGSNAIVLNNFSFSLPLFFGLHEDEKITEKIVIDSSAKTKPVRISLSKLLYGKLQRIHKECFHQRGNHYEIILRAGVECIRRNGNKLQLPVVFKILTKLEFNKIHYEESYSPSRNSSSSDNDIIPERNIENALTESQSFYSLGKVLNKLEGVLTMHNVHLIYFDIHACNRSDVEVSLRYNVGSDLISHVVKGKPDINYWNEWTKEENWEFLFGCSKWTLLYFFHVKYKYTIEKVIKGLSLTNAEALFCCNILSQLGIDREQASKRVKNMTDEILDYFKPNK